MVFTSFCVFCGCSNRRWIGSRWWRWGAFGGHEAAFFVGAVAKGFIFGLTTAAESDGRLVGGDGEGISRRINDGEWAFDEEGSVVADFDRDLRHGGFLE